MKIQFKTNAPLSNWLHWVGQSLLVAILTASLLTACTPAVDPATEPGNGGTSPRDTTVTKPGNSTTTPPGSATGSPSDGPVGVFKTFRISWSPTDFQEIQFDAADKPVRYSSKNLYVMGGNSIVQQRTYQFRYGSNGDVYQVDRVEGGYLRYTYQNNQISRVDEYTAKDRLSVSRTYQYSATNQLVQLDESFVLEKRETRKTYQYDARGNLTLLSEFVRSPADGTYRLDTTTAFEEYDAGRHVENLLSEFPFLPGVTFRTNNYGRKIGRYRDGSEISRDTYTYTYNGQGQPTQQIRRNTGGTLTATYTY